MPETSPSLKVTTRLFKSIIDCNPAIMLYDNEHRDYYMTSKFYLIPVYLNSVLHKPFLNRSLIHPAYLVYYRQVRKEYPYGTRWIDFDLRVHPDS